MIYQTMPYCWAKSANVLDLMNPHIYYFVNGSQNCQVQKKIELPLMPEQIDLLPAPVNGRDGFYRVRISFVAPFGKPEFTSHTDGWKQIEPHIKFIYPAAKLLAECYMKLPDLNVTNPDIMDFTNQARGNFEENCKNTFYKHPLQKLHPFHSNIKDTSPILANITNFSSPKKPTIPSAQIVQNFKNSSIL